MARKRSTRSKAKKATGPQFVALVSSCGNSSQLEAIMDPYDGSNEKTFDSKELAKKALNNYREYEGCEVGTAVIAQIVSVGKASDFTWDESKVRLD